MMVPRSPNPGGVVPHGLGLDGPEVLPAQHCYQTTDLMTSDGADAS